MTITHTGTNNSNAQRAPRNMPGSRIFRLLPASLFEEVNVVLRLHLFLGCITKPSLLQKFVPELFGNQFCSILELVVKSSVRKQLFGNSLLNMEHFMRQGGNKWADLVIAYIRSAVAILISIQLNIVSQIRIAL